MAETFKQPQTDLDPDLRGKIIGALSRGFIPDTDDFYKAIGRDASYYGVKPTAEWGLFDDLAHRPLFGGYSKKEQKAMQEQGAISEYIKSLPPAMLAPQPAMPQTTQQAFGTMPGPASAVPSLQPTPIEVGQQPGFDYGKEQFKNLMGLGDSPSQALPPTWQTPVEFNPAMAPNRRLQPVEQAALAGLREAELKGNLSFPGSAIQPPSVVTKGMELQAEAQKPAKPNEAIQKFTEAMKLAGIDPQSDEGKKWAAQYVETIASHAKPNVTNLNVNAFTPASVEAQKEQMKSTRTTFDQLKQAPVLLENIDKAKELIPKAKGFMGTGGETLLEAAKFMNNRLGTTINTEGIKSAEELRSRIFFNIMDNLKKMDAQPSQMQQQIMQDSLGKLGTDPNALANVLDAYGDSVRRKIELYNTEVESAEQRGVKFPYDPRIKMKQMKKSAATTKTEGAKVLRFDSKGNQIQ